MLALVGKALGPGVHSSLMREVFTRRILGPVTAGLEADPAAARLRGALVGSQLMGLVVARCLLRIEPLATAHDSLGHVHDRAPVIIPPSMYAWWLDPDTTDKEKVQMMLDAIPEPRYGALRKAPALVDGMDPTDHVGKCLLASPVSQAKKAKKRKQASESKPVLLATLGSLWKGI